jgi:hypothetical protein
MLRELARTSQQEERAMDEILHPVAQRAPEPTAQQISDQSPDPNAEQDAPPQLVSGSGCRRSPSPRARWGLLR